MSNSPLGPSEFFAIFFAKISFLGSAKCNENGTILGRPGARFAAPNVISKGAQISRQFRENFTKISKKNGVTAQP
jgi:hypothetical protein